MVEANKHIFVKHFLGLMRSMTSAPCQQTAVDWYNKGCALDDQGKHDEAIKAYDEAIMLDPNCADAWYNKGATLDDQGKYDEAIKCFDEAIRLDPTYTKAYYAKGLILKYLDKTSESNAAFAKAKELENSG